MAKIKMYDKHNTCYREVTVDAEDVDRISQYQFTRSSDGYYGGMVDTPNGERKFVSLQRFLVNCTDSKSVHHIDLRKDNNSKSNLLICSKKEHGIIHASLLIMAKYSADTNSSNLLPTIGVDVPLSNLEFDGDPPEQMPRTTPTGRPKGSLNNVDARNNDITIKFNDDELAEVKKRAKESNLKLAVYIRRALR